MSESQKADLVSFHFFFSFLFYLEVEILKYEMAGEFLAEIKKEFGRGNKETVKVVELKRIE